MSAVMRQELPLDVRLMNFTSRALVWLFVLGALVAGGNWMLRQPWWAIRSVRVEGALQHVSAAALRTEALPRVQGNWFTVRLGAVQQAFDQVPWVRKAVVQRVWPLSLIVQLQEQQPLALWLDASGNPTSLVNRDGEPFEANLGEVQDLGLPRFYGPAGAQARVSGMYRTLQQQFAPMGWRIATLGLNAQGDWSVQLVQPAQAAPAAPAAQPAQGTPAAQAAPAPRQLRIDLGGDADAQAFAQRLQRFVQLAPRVAARYGRPIVSADLRYANGFAVRLADDGAQASKKTSAAGASAHRPTTTSTSRGAR